MNTKGIVWVVSVIIIIIVIGGAVWYFSSSEDTNINEATNTNTLTNTNTQLGFEPVISTKPVFVFSIEPATGSQAGGDAITVVGQNFIDGAKVYINDALATDIAFVSETELTAKTPSGVAGEVKVKVSNPDGISGTLSNGFSYE